MSVHPCDYDDFFDKGQRSMEPYIAQLTDRIAKLEAALRDFVEIAAGIGIRPPTTLRELLPRAKALLAKPEPAWKEVECRYVGIEWLAPKPPAPPEPKPCPWCGGDTEIRAHGKAVWRACKKLDGLRNDCSWTSETFKTREEAMGNG